MKNDAADEATLTMTELRPLEALFCEGFPSTWLELSTSLYGHLMAITPSIGEPDQLAKYAVSLTRKLAQDFGGQALYIPKGFSFEAKKMADKVRAEFRGNNARQLAIKWGVSQMRINQIVGR